MKRLRTWLSLSLGFFVLAEVNYPQLSPHSQLTIFATLGLILSFIGAPGQRDVRIRIAGYLAALLSLACGVYLVVQTEPLFSSLWISGQSLGNRAGLENQLDLLIGGVGLLLVFVATVRAIGWTLPLLALAFLLYGFVGPYLPSWMLPHRGYGLGRLVSQTFLQSQGVFGVALRVMFSYVYLFVLVGAFLEQTGATRFILDAARRFLGNSPGGPAKVAVLSSGLMGSLSGSAVANTAATGTFTIPLMRSVGFPPHVAAAVEAAASSGGALVPPVMGAAAYMMLELVQPAVTYLQIIRAALLPAILYYVSLLLIVHLYARRRGVQSESIAGKLSSSWPQGLIFCVALGALVTFLVLGFTPFRAVSLALPLILLLAAPFPESRMGWSRLVEAFEKAARGAVPLIAASACVGIVIGVVTLTGFGTRLPALILPLAQQNLTAALFLLMACSIVLGMGLPSAVCYLLMATFVGPALGQLEVVPLAAHFFIFYFGMLSMVTPPVALAAYASATIADAKIMPTAMAAFRFSLVGFALPFLFVFYPELLLLAPDGSQTGLVAALPALIRSVLGIVALAASVAGFLAARLSTGSRIFLGMDALLLFFGPGYMSVLAGGVLLGVVAVISRRSASSAVTESVRQ